MRRMMWMMILKWRMDVKMDTWESKCSSVLLLWDPCWPPINFCCILNQHKLCSNCKLVLLRFLDFHLSSLSSNSVGIYLPQQKPCWRSQQPKWLAELGSPWDQYHYLYEYFSCHFSFLVIIVSFIVMIVSFFIVIIVSLLSCVK